MIQRIQSIYLTSSIVFLGICFFSNFGQIGQGIVGMYHITDGAGQQIAPNAYYIFLPLTLTILLNLLAIFNYKSRPKQMAIVRFTFIVLAVVFILSTLYVLNAKEILASEAFVPGMAFIAPSFAFICNFLALKAIRKDEALVRSVNRIR
jgi:glucan phosphoethanolaminetransferase (alkaline phosphatase superfamily)